MSSSISRSASRSGYVVEGGGKLWSLVVVFWVASCSGGSAMVVGRLKSEQVVCASLFGA